MSKSIIAVNAGPRKGWNTDTLIMEAAKGAESAGAVDRNSISSGWRSTPVAFPASGVKRKRTWDTASVGMA